MRFINADFHITHNLLVCVVEEILSVRSAPDRGLVGHVKKNKRARLCMGPPRNELSKGYSNVELLGYVAGNTFFSKVLGCAKE